MTRGLGGGTLGVSLLDYYYYYYGLILILFQQVQNVPFQARLRFHKIERRQDLEGWRKYDCPEWG